MSKLIGNRYGSLLVLDAYTARTSGGNPKRMLRVKCDCGKEFTRADKSIKRAKHPTCRGCYLNGAGKKKEFGNQHPLYDTWKMMRQRCSLPSASYYDIYGGRGITVDPRWDDFETFCKDMGDRPSKRHSLDRIDNDGPYSPENCRWATPEEQASNRSNTINITLGGRTKPLSRWAALMEISDSTLRQRIKGSSYTPREVLLDAIAEHTPATH